MYNSHIWLNIRYQALILCISDRILRHWILWCRMSVMRNQIRIETTAALLISHCISCHSTYQSTSFIYNL